jgi:hypothetical protein
MIDYWNTRNQRHKATVAIVHDQIESENVILSAISKMELLTGVANKTEMAAIVKKLTRYNILLINDEITIKAFELLQNYYLSHSLQLPDALIAATAIVAGFELFSYNTKDFRFIIGLKLFKPS